MSRPQCTDKWDNATLPPTLLKIQVHQSQGERNTNVNVQRQTQKQNPQNTTFYVQSQRHRALKNGITLLPSVLVVQGEIAKQEKKMTEEI